MDVEPEKEVVDALIFQEAADKVAKQGAASSQAVGDAGEISKLFGDSEAWAGPEVEIGALCQARTTIVKSLEFEPKEMPQAPLVIHGLRGTPTKKKD